MKRNNILFLKSFLIGVAKIIPGVSGAMLAISFNLYEKGINAIRYFHKDIKNNAKFLLVVGIGVLLAIVLTSKIVLYFLTTYYLITMLFFIGLISGGINSLKKHINTKNKTNIIFLIVGFLIVIIIPFISSNNSIVFDNSINSFITLIGIGIIDAATMIIPGISGTAIMMLIGCYDEIIYVLSDLTNIDHLVSNMYILLPFIIGTVVGIILLVFLMNYLFKNFYGKTYSIIIGLAYSSIFILFLKTFNGNYNVFDIVIGLIMLIIGFNISKKLE